MNSFYWVFYTLFKSISKAFFSWKVVNREKLIEDGPVLIVSNHQSFLDPPMLGISYEDGIYFFARKTLFQGIFKWALPLCQAIPIDQENPDAASLKHVIRLLKSGKRVLVFPEGSRTPDGKIHDGMGGIGLILSNTNVPGQPLRISGAAMLAGIVIVVLFAAGALALSEQSRSVLAIAISAALVVFSYTLCKSLGVLKNQKK